MPVARREQALKFADAGDGRIIAPPLDASVDSPLGNGAIFSSHSSSREQQLRCPGYQQICWRQKKMPGSFRATSRRKFPSVVVFSR